MEQMDAKTAALCAQNRWDFSDLRAMYINCTLKRSPALSHTQGLADRSMAILRTVGVEVEAIRAVDHELPVGVYPDMTEHGWPADEWPELFDQGDGGRHPGPVHPHLAGGEVVGVHQGH